MGLLESWCGKSCRALEAALGWGVPRLLGSGGGFLHPSLLPLPGLCLCSRLICCLLFSVQSSSLLFLHLMEEDAPTAPTTTAPQVYMSSGQILGRNELETVLIPPS